MRRCAAFELDSDRGERGGRNDQNVREPAGDLGRDERLTHADIVAEEDTAKLFERRLHSAYCGLLVGLQCDLTQARASFVCAEHELSNSSAYDRR